MILFDHGPQQGRPALFDAPLARIAATTPEGVPDALAALAVAQAQGFWLAGYAAYELGYALEPRLAPLMPAQRRLPLLDFTVHDAPRDGAAALAACHDAAGRATLGPLRPGWTRAQYGRAFARVADYIAAGDCYQINLTMPLHTRADGGAQALYGALRRRQPVRYGALIDRGEGTPAILSRSPELFFRIDAQGRIEARPMKGTAPRHPDPAKDAKARHELSQSLKNRAENLMIVDLLRNDISRICHPGSVKVPALYSVESFATVHQMSSQVIGQLQPGTTPETLLRALFPCGSITGAPKIRAMEIIRSLEPAPRGAYCGAIGWLAPDGRAEFNVAIRTLTLFDGGEAVMNVGGGVVQDSTADGEYEEALWKARFAHLT
ncbi:aminodeoxychorismate synthase component I [Alkalilacustris brevis]|uniref:aminodeoxychorismate synthase component I n=1 Tax=Alkalilacustris brevis TaxID=2026338 RepID=UPI000E0D2003|nr:aminodeoxychorismate synthase component I [Alkalilacustris brevis]